MIRQRLLLQSIILLIISFPLIITVNQIYVPCDPICIDKASELNLSGMKIRCYNGNTLENYMEVTINNSIQLFNKLNSNKSIILYIYGWTGETILNQLSTDAVIKALLQSNNNNNNNDNICLLNWSTISLTEYTFAARSVQGVGYTVAKEFLNKISSAGFNESSVHLIGHSLGAHIAGFIGKYANFLIPRITGLDPAGPLFNVKSSERLSESDGKFVDIIHTNSGVFGTTLKLGNVDFYPNNESGIQTGCLLEGLDICSHYRACYYYAESVNNGRSFIGRKCNSYREFKFGLCDTNSKAVMGHHTPNNKRGNFYLKTNEVSPYGRGETGALSK